jgi:uncharacterized membrane protein YgdD (TMEM256/DUF423 family)
MSERARWILLAAGALIALATILGAFGTHGLQARLPADRLRVYDTAVRYHFYHSLGLLGIGFAAQIVHTPWLGRAAALVIAGIALFSGSLYALTFGAPRVLGIVTPFGGIALIVGWIVFALTVYRVRSQ